MKQIGITAGTAQVQKKLQVLLGTGRILRFLKFKATGCGSISTVFSSIVLLCVSSVIIIMIMIIIIIMIVIIIIIIAVIMIILKIKIKSFD